MLTAGVLSAGQVPARPDWQAVVMTARVRKHDWRGHSEECACRCRLVEQLVDKEE